MDDIMLRRLRKERRRRRVEEAPTAPNTETPAAAVETRTHAAGMTTLPEKQQQQQHASKPKVLEQTERSFVPGMPQDTFFPPRRSNGNHLTLPKDVGYIQMKSSPSSSVSMSQSPVKLVATNHSKRPVESKKGLLDSDDSSEEEDILELSKQQLRRMQERGACEAAAVLHVDAQVVVKEKVADAAVLKTPAAPEIGRKAQQPAARLKKACSNDYDDDSDSQEDFLALEAAKWQRRQLAKGTSFSGANPAEPNDDTAAAAAAVAVAAATTLRTTPRNPLALMREQKAADVNNLHSPSRKVADAAGKQQLWSDSEEEEAPAPSVMESSSKKEKKKKGDDDIEAQLAAFVDKNREKKRRVDMNLSKRDRDVSRGIVPNIANISVEDEEDLRSQWKPEFDRPKFGPYDPPTPLMLGGGETGYEEFHVPASISRFLPEYQREGIEFLYNSAIAVKKGAILGDDMGLGKTVQTISLLAALFRKTGTGLDLLELSRRKKIVEARIARIQSEKEKALMAGNAFIEKKDEDVLKEIGLPAWSPVLIVAPNSVITNWVDDFKTWAHFSVAVYGGAEREAALESVENGVAEVLVCGHSMIGSSKHFQALKAAKVQWKVVIVDEFHVFKNVNKNLATNLRAMRDVHQCIVVGLTGTVMQNAHNELWNLVDIVAKDHLGPYTQFDMEYARPIKLSRTTDATSDVVEMGALKAVELSTKLYEVYLRRSKEEKLADLLPTKDERIIFCEPSPLQKELYKYIIDQPDFLLLRHKNAPCDCGVNQKFFLEYKHLRSQEEQTAYQRKHRKNLKTRGQCCFPIPKLDRDSGGIDPGAVLWRQQHPGDQPCDDCPSCILFAAISILYKLSSHAALLQVKTPPNQFGVHSAQRAEAEKKIERLRQFIPEHLLSKLPGGFFRDSGIMDDHFSLSGKMVVLDKLLRAISAQQGRVLLFSQSTEALDLIQNYVMAMGYSFLRMDGQTPTKKRTDIATRFRASAETFVFLLSTRAMGLGLNLTQANFVILFDVDWNPASDSQAQDRAYRIGQERSVKVFRLVSRGTIEELKYLRQVYKTQLQSETIVDVNDSDRQKASRLFRGVEGDISRKGELFGQENLLKFKDGTFMNYASRMSESRQYGVGVHDTNNLLDAVKDLTEEDLNDIGEVGNVFGDLARCTESAACAGNDRDRDSDWEDDSHIGGMSQAVMDICERVEVHQEDDVILAQIREEKEAVSASSSLFRSPLSEANDSPQGRKASAIIRAAGVDATVRSSAPFANDSSTVEATDAPHDRKQNAVIHATALADSVSSCAPFADDNDGVEGNDSSLDRQVPGTARPSQPLADGYAATETQSPINVALSLNPNIEKGKRADERILNDREDIPPMSHNKKSISIDHIASETAVVVGEPGPVAAEKKSLPWNTQVVGKTTDKIRRGEAGQTTFTASDLFLPVGSRKKKRKKSSNS